MPNQETAQDNLTRLEAFEKAWNDLPDELQTEITNRLASGDELIAAIASRLLYWQGESEISNSDAADIARGEDAWAERD
jgi:hypothetical protein